MKVPHWIAEARILATSPSWKHGRPYYRTGMMNLIPVAREGLGTMAVDEHWRLYYDPRLPEVWSPQEIAAVLIHELEHLLRGHPKRARAGSFQPRRYNLAADLAINDDLKAEGLPLPKGALYPDRYGFPTGLLEEEYYRLLEEAGEGGEDQGESSGKGKDSEARANPLAGHDGSGASGKPAPWEEPAPGSQKGDREVPGISEAESEIIRRLVAKDVREAAAREPGRVPARLKRWAQALLEPRVDWRRELAAQVRRGLELVRGLTDYSYRKPSRRQAEGLILPGMVSPEPAVAVVVDTSGSMDQDLLNRALAELSGILSSVRGSQGVTVLAVDAAVHSVRRVFRPEQVELLGGGGTNMGVGIEAALKLRPRPDLIVVLTDGHTPWPEKPPKGVRVVVGLLGDGKAPAWARTVRIEGES